MPCFSPSGGEISFISNMSQLWRVPYTSGWPMQITAEAVPVGGHDWSPVSNRIAYIAGVGEYVIGICNPDGTDERSYKGLYGSRGLSWTADGKKILVAAKNVGIDKDFSPYIIDAENGEKTLCGKEGAEYPCDLSPDGKTVLLHSVINNFNSNLYLQDLETNKRRLITLHKKPARYFGGYLSPRCRPRFSSDGKSIYFATNAGRDISGFARLSLDGTREDCPVEFLSTKDKAELSGFLLDKDEKVALLAWHQSGADALSLYDLNSKIETNLPTIPGNLLVDIDISPDGARIAANVQDDLKPLDIYVKDKSADQDWKQITFSQHPGWDPAKMAKPEKISFIDSRGITLQGTLIRAQNCSLPAPCVIVMGRTDKAAECQILAKNGISVFSPSVLEALETSKMTNTTQVLQAEMEKLKYYVEYLKQNKIAEPKHLGITGHSKYGFFSLAAICKYPDTFAACYESAGWADFAVCRDNTDKSEASFFNREYGSPKPGSEQMKFLSPIADFDAVKAAVMVQHGEKDKTVPIQAAHQIVETLKKSAKPVESIINKDEGHDYSKTENKLEASVALVDFFIRHLKDTQQ